MENNKSKLITTFKIITIILFSLATLFSLVWFIGAFLEPEGLGRGVALALSIVFGLFSAIISFLPAVIGLIISIVKKASQNTGKKPVILFTIFTVLPLIIYLIIFLLAILS